jgi:cell division protein FtsZ
MVGLAGLEELKEAAHGVVCLPNQKVTKIIDEQTSVLDAFKLAGELLADAVLGIWRLLSHKGLIEIHVADLCELLRGRHADCAFAVAQAAGPTRSRDVMDKLLAHPMLDGGESLSDADAVLVSLMAGPDLTMTEVNRVMEEVSRKCAPAQVIMGAAIEQAFAEQLAVTMIVARKSAELTDRETTPRSAPEGLDAQLMDRRPTARPGSRFVPPPPVLPPEKMRQMLAEQSAGASRPRKARSKMRQGQLPLEIVSKGRFDKSEPTIYKGEDLDVPTYIRRGVSLN